MSDEYPNQRPRSHYSAALRRADYVASEANAERQKDCMAPGCPRHRNIEVDGKWLCMSHAYAPREEWDGITRRMQLGIARAGLPAIMPPADTAPARRGPPPGAIAELRKAIAALQGGSGRPDGKALAERLRRRQKAGERLSKPQRDFLARYTHPEGT